MSQTISGEVVRAIFYTHQNGGESAGACACDHMHQRRLFDMQYLPEQELSKISNFLKQKANFFSLKARASGKIDSESMFS